MKKYVVYFNLSTVSNSSENIENLPIITIINDGEKKFIFRGLEEVAAIIVETTEYLGQDQSQLIPFAVEIVDIDER